MFLLSTLNKLAQLTILFVFVSLTVFWCSQGGKENINRDEMGLKRLERTLPNAFKKL